MFSLLKSSMRCGFHRQCAISLKMGQKTFPRFDLGVLLSEDEATASLQKLSKDEDFQLQVIQLHYDILKHCLPTAKFPKTMTNAMWLHMLQNYATTEESRLTGFVHMEDCEFKMQKDLLREKKVKKSNAQNQPQIKSTFVPKQLNNKIILTEKGRGARNMARCYNEVCFNMQHSSPVVIDFAYFDKTNPMPQYGELKDCFRDNLVRRMPFYFEMCNLPDVGDDLSKQLHELVFHDLGPECPYLFTKRSYVDLHPKENIVYLSNASANILESHDPNTVYVFGHSERMASVAKPKIVMDATKAGIKSARIPFSLAKSKTRASLRQCVQLLSLFQFTGSWKKAIEIYDQMND